jgi:hypothetical protein
LRAAFAAISPASGANLFPYWVIRPQLFRIMAMLGSQGAIGFNGRAPVSSFRLMRAVAASLAISALSLCLVVTVTVLSTEVGMAAPIESAEGMACRQLPNAKALAPATTVRLIVSH